MYDMKNIEPRMKPWGASTLTDYSCRRLLSRTIASCLLQQNDKVTRKALVYLLDIIARKSANEWKDERFTSQVFKKKPIFRAFISFRATFYVANFGKVSSSSE